MQKIRRIPWLLKIRTGSAKRHWRGSPEAFHSKVLLEDLSYVKVDVLELHEVPDLVFEPKVSKLPIISASVFFY